jgi:Flp pilus assembly protein TadG
MRARAVKKERGAAVLEAAILLPLLVVLVFGIIDVGRLVFTKTTLHDAAQEGSIYGAYNPGNASDVQDRVVTAMDNLELDTADVVVECPAGVDTIRVTVTKDMSMITPIFAGRTVTLSSTVEGDLLSDDTCQASP